MNPRYKSFTSILKHLVHFHILIATTACGMGSSKVNNFAYESGVLVFPTSEAISVSPIAQDSGLTRFYAVAPLPEGLSVDQGSGKIVGSPSRPTPVATYPIAAWSASDNRESTASITIKVVESRNVSLSLGDRDGLVLKAGTVGLSFEKTDVKGYLRQSNSNLVGLIRGLGTRVIRIGGNSSDKILWSRTGATSNETLDPSSLKQLSGFLAETQSSAIYTLNLVANNPEMAADEAKAVAEVLGPQLWAFAIGNEPDMYIRHGYRDSTYSFSQYLGEWRSIRDAVLKSVPEAQFVGADSAYSAWYYTGALAGAEPGLKELGHHYYRSAATSPTATIQTMMSTDTVLPLKLQELTKAVQRYHIAGGFRISEANSFSSGGTPGVSNAFGSALWAVEFFLTSIRGGAIGVNFHTGGRRPGYTPIADDELDVIEVRPEYYGLKILSLLDQGMFRTATTTPLEPLLSVWSVERPTGGTAILLVNKNEETALRMTLSPVPSGLTSARYTRLTAPSLSSLTGQSLGGSTIGLDGTWNPRERTPVPFEPGRNLTFTIAPASANLVELEH